MFRRSSRSKKGNKDSMTEGLLANHQPNASEMMLQPLIAPRPRSNSNSKPLSKPRSQRSNTKIVNKPPNPNPKSKPNPNPNYVLINKMSDHRLRFFRSVSQYRLVSIPGNTFDGIQVPPMIIGHIVVSDPHIKLGNEVKVNYLLNESTSAHPILVLKSRNNRYTAYMPLVKYKGKTLHKL